MEGWVFDIGEASVHDGPGLRTTVFLKGCPLRCRWCHSPEGQSPEPETLQLPVGDRICGVRWESGELARYLAGVAALLGAQGGITFTGGEPLMQAPFLLEVLKKLRGIHTVVETSGFCGREELLRASESCSLIHYGVKILDDAASKYWTTVPARMILENLRALDDFEDGAGYIFRLPLIGGVIDAELNLRALMALSRTLRRLQRIDFLPVNRLAPAKYAACGRVFDPACANVGTGRIPEWFAPGVPWRLLT